MKRWARGPLLPVLSVGLLVAALCALLLRGRKRPAPVSNCVPFPESWATDTRDPATSYPTPSEPFPGQKRAPCDVPPEVEAGGGCWVELKMRPPCGKLAYENAGRCLMPVLAAKRVPVSSPAER